MGLAFGNVLVPWGALGVTVGKVAAPLAQTGARVIHRNLQDADLGSFWALLGLIWEPFGLRFGAVLATNFAFMFMLRFLLFSGDFGFHFASILSSGIDLGGSFVTIRVFEFCHNLSF